MIDVKKINIPMTPQHGYLAELRAAWTEGKVSGSATAVDFNALLNEARSELVSIRNRCR